MIFLSRIWYSITQIANRKLICFVLPCLIILSAEEANSGMPFPSPVPLDYFLSSKKPLIFIGKFTRIVYIDGKAGELIKFTDRDLSGELSFMEKPENRSVSDQFMEIIDAKVYMMAPDSTDSLKYVEHCEFKKLYISSKIDLINEIERDLYYKSLVGNEVVLFLSYRATYQRGVEKFSTPIFIPALGSNWNDGKPLPVESLTSVKDFALRAGFAAPTLKSCNKVK